MTKNKSENPWDDIKPEQRLRLIEKGVGKCESKTKVAIVGAGMAGLVAAYELSKANYDVVILEAQHRVGGRVLTLREPFTDGLRAEAGAMRLSINHKLTKKYVEMAFGESVETIFDSPEQENSNFGVFNMSCDKALCFFNNVPRRFEEYKKKPEALKFNAPRRIDINGRLRLDNVDGIYRTAEDLWDNVMEAIRLHYCDPLTNKPNWEKLTRSFDHVSTRDFLEQGGATELIMSENGTTSRGEETALFEKWTQQEIHMFGMLENQQARLNNSVLALLREWIDSPLDGKAKYYYIKDGMDRLPKWFLGNLREKIRFGASVEAIEQISTSKGDYIDKYRLIYRTAAQTVEKEDVDHVIFAVPFTVLRHLRGAKMFSPDKRRAIQALNYSAAGKIFLQCRERFWENEKYTGKGHKINGGRSQTDLALRSVWYPQHGGKTGRGVLLASYTWGRDAESWGYLSDPERIRRAIERLDDLHVRPDGQPFIIEENIVEIGTSVMWQNDPFAGGAFALFNPRQEQTHRQAVRQIEGLVEGKKKRIHFAGEHTCPEYHRWIEGAVDSGLRVAWEVIEASRQY